MRTLYVTMNKEASSIYTYIQSLRHATAVNMPPHIYTFATDLKSTTLSMDNAIADVDEAIYNMLKDIDAPLSLEGFRDGPPSSEVSRCRNIFAQHIS